MWKAAVTSLKYSTGNLTLPDSYICLCEIVNAGWLLYVVLYPVMDFAFLPVASVCITVV